MASRVKCWPSCALGSKQPNGKCLLPSSEAVGNTQTIEPDSASKQEFPAGDAARENSLSF